MGEQPATLSLCLIAPSPGTPPNSTTRCPYCYALQLQAGCCLSPLQPLLLPTSPSSSLFSIYFTLTFSFDPFMLYRPFVSVLILSFCLCYVLQFQITRNISCISLFSSFSHKSKEKIKRNSSFCLSEALFMRLVGGSVAQHQLEWTLDTIILMRELLMQMKSICLRENSLEKYGKISIRRKIKHNNDILIVLLS